MVEYTVWYWRWDGKSWAVLTTIQHGYTQGEVEREVVRRLRETGVNFHLIGAEEVIKGE